MENIKNKEQLSEIIDAVIGAYVGTKIAKRAEKVITDRFSSETRKKRQTELKKQAEKNRKEALKKQKLADKKLKQDQAKRAKSFVQKYKKRKSKKPSR